MKALLVCVAVVCAGCGAAAPPYQHDIHDAMTTITQPPTSPPQCAPGGGDTVATNVYFEFQVAKTAIARDGASEALMRSGKRVLLNFVVDTAGVPIVSTVRPVYAADTAGARLAQPIVGQLRFKPAERDGCRVRQLVQGPVRVPSVK